MPFNIFEKKKQEIITKASASITKVFKRDIIALLGEDAREEDVEVITKYFDEGHAVNAAKSALEADGII